MSTTFRFKRLLLVDDNPLETLITTRILRKMKLFEHIDSVDSGERALICLSTWRSEHQYPEVILLDVNMPLMNGFAFLEKALTAGLLAHSLTKTIMLTSSIHPADQQQAARYSAAGYLLKPLVASNLVAAL